MADPNLPHPMRHEIPRERLDREYFNVTVDRSPDPAWHFRLNLHRETRIGPDGHVAPTAAAPFQSLALFQRPEPLADLEIFGLHLPAEIDPVDWLDVWLERHGMVVASRELLHTPRGVLGDAVCTWDTPEGPFAGRFVTLRWGTRIFFLTLRTPRENYPRVADDFFLAASSFTPVDPDEGRLTAEPSQATTFTTPVTAAVVVPASYAVAVSLQDADATAFSAEQQPIADLPEDPAFGKLNFLCAKASMADHPAKAAALYLNALMQNPITLGGDEFQEEESPPAPFEQSWLLVTPATLSLPGEPPTACELRCRVLARRDLWLVGGVFGPARHAAPVAWMRNKRALDLVTSTFAL